MNQESPGGRHRRRRENAITRTAFDEARRAGLVRRHLTKLRYLAERTPPTAEPDPRTPKQATEGPHSTSDAA